MTLQDVLNIHYYDAWLIGLKNSEDSFITYKVSKESNNTNCFNISLTKESNNTNNFNISLTKESNNTNYFNISLTNGVQFI
jgi:hypothetical protein